MPGARALRRSFRGAQSKTSVTRPFRHRLGKATTVSLAASTRVLSRNARSLGRPGRLQPISLREGARACRAADSSLAFFDHHTEPVRPFRVQAPR
jgi:hypothetical protein